MSLSYWFWSFDQSDVSRSFALAWNIVGQTPETRLWSNVEAKSYCSRRSSHLWNEDSFQKRIASQMQLLASCDSAKESAQIIPPVNMTSTKDFTLIQAQVIFRHGARTPIWVLPEIQEARYDKKTFKAVLSHCNFDFQLVHLSGSKAQGFAESPINKRYKRKLDGGIRVGQLTTVGMQQCYDLGLALRRRYVHKHKLVSHIMSEEDVYFRTTFVSRTIESLQGVVAGLYGVDQFQGDIKPKFKVAYYNEEVLYPNPFMCDCLKEIVNHGIRHINQDNPGRAEFLEKVHSAISYTGRKSQLDFIAVRDDLYARDAHSQIIPAELEEMFEDIHKQASIDFVQKIVGKPKDRAAGLMLALGPFHHLLFKNMDAAIDGSKQSKKLYLYSSHDNMIMPLLVSMGCYDWEWPPYAAHLSYELWQHKDSGDYFVKILYNGKELQLPGKDDIMIPYGEFKEFLQALTLSPKEYEYLCEHSRVEIEAPPIEHSRKFDYQESHDTMSNEEEEEEQAQAPSGM